jgi:hypothetical protein
MFNGYRGMCSDQEVVRKRHFRDARSIPISSADHILLKSAITEFLNQHRCSERNCKMNELASTPTKHFWPKPPELNSAVDTLWAMM